MAVSNKELKRLLRGSEIDPELSIVASQEARLFAVNSDGEYEYLIADVHGGKERFAIAQLLALATVMARELLASRKVVRAAQSFTGSVNDYDRMRHLLAAYYKARKG